MTIPSSEESNYETFRDCLSEAVVQRLSAPQKPVRRRAAKGRKNGVKAISKAEKPSKEETASTSHENVDETNDAEDLVEFIDVSPPSSSHCFNQ